MQGIAPTMPRKARMAYLMSGNNGKKEARMQKINIKRFNWGFVLAVLFSLAVWAIIIILVF